MPINLSSDRSIFCEAVELTTPAERAEYLDRVCQGNPALRGKIEALLQAHDEAGQFLGNVAATSAATEFAATLPQGLGTMIGPYKLREVIGEGGMGIVYVAEQEHPIRRKVALKVIKPGMDTREVIARFEAERQALALMDHPNIAKVLDAGAVGQDFLPDPSDDRPGQTDAAFGSDAKDVDDVARRARQAGKPDQRGGRPYFVMELVRGIPITDYCDQCSLSPGDRLKLFVQVCQAVQHAHQKGIIHRDLKPSNVMVTLHDGVPVPKVIDFGVAKALNQRLGEHTIYTAVAQIVGTPLYMSPEQAELSGFDVDTRSDVYSLGVLLYELLTGMTPFDKDTLAKVGFDEMRRIIREDEPPRPSVRVSTLAAEKLSTVTQRRGIDARRLGGILRGELDWIVMKALEKDRNRRYETANGLAMDVQRYLKAEPVQACPPSAVYRFRTFARRNKAALLTVSVIAAALVSGTVVSTWMAIRAAQAERSAEANYDRARRAVDDMYTQVAEKWLTNQPKLEPLQREFLQKAADFYTEFAQEASSDPALRLETAKALRRVGEIQHRLGEPKLSEQFFEQAIDRMQALVDEFPTVPEFPQILADALHKFGVLVGDTGRYPDEEQAHRRALTLEEQLAARFPDVPIYRRDLARAHWFLGRALVHFLRRPEAEKSFHAAIEIQNRLVAEFPSVPEYRFHLAASHLALGEVARHQNRPEEYRQELLESSILLEQLVAEFPTSQEYRNELANVCYWRANVLPAAEAQQSLQRALTLQQKLADDFPAVADYRYDLVRTYEAVGDRARVAGLAQEAEQAYRQGLAVGEKLVADSPTVHYYGSRLGTVITGLARLFVATGRVPEAEAAFRRSIGLYERFVVDFPDVIFMSGSLFRNCIELAALLDDNGRPDDAKVFYRKALAVNPKDVLTASQQAWLTSTHADTELRDPRRSLETAELLVKRYPQEGAYWNTLGVARIRTGNWRDAQTALETSMNLRHGGDAFDWFFLAMTHWHLDDKDAAREWHRRAVEWMEAHSPQDKELKLFRTEAETLLEISNNTN